MSSTREKRVRDQEDQQPKPEENKANPEVNPHEEEEIIDTVSKNPNSNIQEGEFDENIIKSLEKQLKIEDEKVEKAMNYMYKYKEAYGNAFFTNIPIRKLIHGFTREQITKSNFDKSVILNELREKYSNSYYGKTKDGESAIEFYQYLLGEMQFAFILFYLGQNFEGFEQWKKLIILLCH